MKNINILPGEYWYGLCVNEGTKFPLSGKSTFSWHATKRFSIFFYRERVLFPHRANIDCAVIGQWVVDSKGLKLPPRLAFFIIATHERRFRLRAVLMKAFFQIRFAVVTLHMVFVNIE
jgi:hypothetical protein